MAKFEAACTKTIVEIPDHPTPLDIYQACTKMGLMRNQTFSALEFTVDYNMICVDRTRDKQEVLTLHRV